MHSFFFWKEKLLVSLEASVLLLSWFLFGLSLDQLPCLFLITLNRMVTFDFSVVTLNRMVTLDFYFLLDLT